mmetsp:Transcript_5807/g.18702  ORF Transcript_5807/g.18702 Transcript_5807/m.18702 type:complete len:132 (+) Transcript_5807:777-1172(+)
MQPVRRSCISCRSSCPSWTQRVTDQCQATSDLNCEEWKQDMSLIAKMWMLVHPKLPIGCFSLPGAGGCWWLFGFSSGADSPFYLTGWNPFRGCVLCLHLGDVRAGLPSWSAQSCSSSPFHPSVTDSQPEVG